LGEASGKTSSTTPFVKPVATATAVENVGSLSVTLVLPVWPEGAQLEEIDP
jgi:hypothetical protein